MEIRRKDNDIGVTGCIYVVAENETHKVYCDKAREKENYCRYHWKLMFHMVNYQNNDAK